VNTTTAGRPEGSPPAVRIWIDPGCPWAWQTAQWLRELRDGGHLSLEWRIFSLELNSSEPGVDLWEAATLNGEALVSLALARREGGIEAFERFFWALGGLRHDGRTASSPEMVREAASIAGMPSLVDEAVADPTLADLVRAEYEDARLADVFGVPTLQLLPSGEPIYGPIMPVPPKGASALEWWSHVLFALEHDELYELKRWPRTRRPGQTEAT
jgi:predicted DsbA family dithiol-disulfide isomerase